MAIILPGGGGGDGGGTDGGGDSGPLTITFTPPIVYDNPAYLPDSTGPARNLFRYCANRPRRVYVYALSDGTFVQDTATPENSNTNIPYPYNPWDPSAPYASSSYVDFTQTPARVVTSETAHDVWITKVYMTATTVTQSEAYDLTAAGYGDLLS